MSFCFEKLENVQNATNSTKKNLKMWNIYHLVLGTLLFYAYVLSRKKDCIEFFLSNHILQVVGHQKVSSTLPRKPLPNNHLQQQHYATTARPQHSVRISKIIYICFQFLKFFELLLVFKLFFGKMIYKLQNRFSKKLLHIFINFQKFHEIYFHKFSKNLLMCIRF